MTLATRSTNMPEGKGFQTANHWALENARVRHKSFIEPARFEQRAELRLESPHEYV